MGSHPPPSRSGDLAHSAEPLVVPLPGKLKEGSSLRFCTRLFRAQALEEEAAREKKRGDRGRCPGPLQQRGSRSPETSQRGSSFCLCKGRRPRHTTPQTRAKAAPSASVQVGAPAIPLGPFWGAQYSQSAPDFSRVSRRGQQTTFKSLRRSSAAFHLFNHRREKNNPKTFPWRADFAL